MTVGKICNREVVITTPEATLIAVAKLMREYHVGDVVVVNARGDEKVPVGIITDRDIVLAIVASEVDLDAVLAGDIMSHELLTAGEQESIWDVLQRMRAHGVRRLPVVNARGGLEGILSVNDFLELISDELLALAQVATRQQQREKEIRK
ncbi:MAG: CBS domain-containing protein [Desulfobacteraceae bacterium]|jgi:CBS domain-containing protein|nr:CBS domain-containing protein [Desulfobacteraceae bacterium]